jgi:hypothetical protein
MRAPKKQERIRFTDSTWAYPACYAHALLGPNRRDLRRHIAILIIPVPIALALSIQRLARMAAIALDARGTVPVVEFVVVVVVFEAAVLGYVDLVGDEDGGD